MPGGSSSLTGLQEGDIIVELDGFKVTSLEDFQYICMKYQSETILSCKYLHDGEECSGIIYLEPRPQQPLKEFFDRDFVDNSFIPIFGIKMIRSSTTNKKSHRIEQVINGSIADQNGFSENDNLVLHSVKFDDVNEIFFATVIVQRRKKGFLDIQMMLNASYDNPNYF